MSFITAEIQGFKEFQSEVLLQILNSKRLLIDHVELLEECLEDTLSRTDRNAKFTAVKLLLSSIPPVASILLAGQSSQRWVYPLSGLVAAYGSCCCVKWINQHRFQQQRKLLTRFIQSLEQFEMAVKKNILFLNESLHMRSVQTALEKSGEDVNVFAANCATCCINTIKTLHAAVQHLERQFAITQKWNDLCAPIEQLEDCDLFSDEAVAEPKTIKNYYNIFAYIQSQFLTRLGLSVACGLSDLTLCNLPKLCEDLDQQKASCLKLINIVINPKRERVPRIDINILPPELSYLRSLSVGLSAKLYSIVHRYRRFEDSVEEIAVNYYKDAKLISELQALESPVEDIVNDLNASAEECQRLLITMKKILNNEDKSIPLEIDSRFKESLENALDSVVNTERVFSETDKPCIRDEFFAVDGTEKDSVGNEQLLLAPFDDLEHINSKIVKRHFKPVLEQLRERIEPIGIEFKEREKRALKDKGIDIAVSEPDEDSDENGSLDHVGANRTLYSSDSDDDGGNDERNAIKFQRSIQRYDEIRGYLASKEQTNFFGLKPMTSVVNEDVLE